MNSMTKLVYFLALISHSYADNIKVGSMYGTYTHIDDIYKNIITDAAQHINEDGTFLPSSDQLIPVHFNSPTEEGWSRDVISVGIRAACSFINNKDAHAFILPDDVCLDCQGLGYIVGSAYYPTIATDQASGSEAVKMYPIVEDMVELVAGVIKHYRWNTFIVIYDQDSGYTMVEELMNMAQEEGWVMTPIVLEDDVEEQMKSIKKRSVKNIVVYMHVEENIKQVVTAAYDAGLLFDTWHWLFGNPNVSYLGKTFLETKLRYNSAFLTRFKMETASYVGGNYFTRRPDAIRKWPFRQQMTYDALLTVAHALNEYKKTHNYYPESGRCGASKSPLMASFSKVNFEGCSGEVAFDADGNRVNYTVTIYVGKDQYLSTNKLGSFTHNVHHWEEKKGERWPGQPGSRLYMKPYRMAEESHIHVLSIEEPPFLMRHDYEQLRGSSRFRRQTVVASGQELYIGYVPEILEEIKKVFEEDMGLDFTYKLELLGEGNYGRYDKSTQEWDGMMRDIYDGDGDIIAGALTKTGVREQFIDFTSVWYKSDVQLLVQHPTYVWEHPFVVVFPFNIYAWLTNFLAFFVASILMWVVSRLNRREWFRSEEKDEAAGQAPEAPSFFNTSYSMLSIMAMQGYTKSPRSVAGRLLTAVWFVYTLMMIWLYVTSLSPLVKKSKLPYKIRNLFDLNKQEQFAFGVVRKSPTFDLFHEASSGDKRITWDDIQTGDEGKIVKDLQDGIRKVRRDNGRYALLSEKKMLEYEAYRWPCDMLITGGKATKIKFALAVQSGSPLRDQLTHAIKKLKKNGAIANITSKTYHEPFCKKAYSQQWHKEAKKSITSQDLAGVYYLILIGIGATVAIFTIESVYFYLLGDVGIGLRMIPLRSSRRRSRSNVREVSAPVSQNGQGESGQSGQREWI